MESVEQHLRLAICIYLCTSTTFTWAMALGDITISDLWQRPIITPEAQLETPGVIMARGYPVEIHQVTTTDGYILTVERIPHGKEETGEEQGTKPVVYLQHGMAATARVWVMNPSDKSLAFVLADRGYDVWMANTRGTTRSRKHTTLDPNRKYYWKFTLDEMANDISGTINYILEKTGQEKLSYVGHSLGCPLFYIAMIKEPELNDKIDVMIGLGSVAYMSDLRGTMGFLGFFWRYIQLFRFFLKKGPFADNPQGLPLFCDTTLLGAKLCRNYHFSIFGPTKLENFNITSVQVANSFYPSGSSFNVFDHFFQSFLTQDFRRFDYGRIGNLKRYGQKIPPAYDLSRVTAPVVLYYGDSDYISRPEDVITTASKLGNLRKIIRVSDPDFSHGDFLWSTKVDEFVFNSIVDNLPPAT